ncbi:hypothetical protein [uncultured Rhodospira sp.]|uniref:hypothetical protein n=1 Tax=uncultured Rhodospira sp. TaxID=1936189 RepID=UPI002632F845|nr:hypothetical protein [uncultured Rhodospira sp.]
MSRFYMTMNGGKSNSQDVTRRVQGSSAHVTLASWSGAVRVEPYVSEDGRDFVRVLRTPWKGEGGPLEVLYDGPFAREEG